MSSHRIRVTRSLLRCFRFKKDMWEKIAREMALPWRAAEAMHWQIGEVEMANRANVPVFHLAGQNNLQQMQTSNSTSTSTEARSNSASPNPTHETLPNRFHLPDHMQSMDRQITQSAMPHPSGFRRNSDASMVNHDEGHRQYSMPPQHAGGNAPPGDLDVPHGQRRYLSPLGGRPESNR